jgi:hypothetical protein
MPTAKKVTKKAVAKVAKVAKKVPAKKATTKKVTTKKTNAKSTKKVLVCADEGECFWTTDGQILRDLNELQQALAAMEESVFKHHVRPDGNDFANWVEHVLDDAVCAADLRKATKSSQARTVVVRHLRSYHV